MSAEKQNCRQYTILDSLCEQFDKALRTLSQNLPAESRANPAEYCDNDLLSQTEARHVAGLMRINYTGEVCAQALYQGQALTAKDQNIKAKMQQCAEEENDHLNWCYQRLQQLDAKTSYLDPFWYSVSLGIGLFAGLVGDKWSLGFLAETEHQVVKHLESHLEQLPEKDLKSKAILEQMVIDESEHAHSAEDLGSEQLPAPIQWLMRGMSKIMTKTTYYI